MKISIQKILQTDLYRFEENVDLSDLESLNNNDIREIGAVSVTGTASVQGKTITCQFTIAGTMILPCARTLVDVPYPFKINVVELFSIDTYYKEEDESEIHPVHGEVLDLDPFIKENVLLEIPFRVYADAEEIEANALSAGNGWTVISEEEQEEKIDPRFEKLQSLLNKDKNENQ
ncbi:YceD family protein [Amphibacillus jilinensis]|uniref:YceD family protein n=1 Tax=Amphibacillus jilinensis TaxID=1216008 RepID=UPI000303F93B|nr:YceD family protein [Amphibacillus jilinensis]